MAVALEVKIVTTKGEEVCLKEKMKRSELILPLVALRWKGFKRAISLPIELNKDKVPYLNSRIIVINQAASQF
ncbi:hypothetical protein PHAVU_011G129300 [Phaseolus vulgaris]|uniref:Uncharacterized protein n=1 Tax=Phaseolus vulgaris TaxID=3885 RepID=V7AJ02_PHAVU|nr:hypothetical protein PHAVU_011G129300g [Phaseolus vulgaris]ESW04838.1 hypothetical protein PHAVU_011G129300g [Phaseolus vulgaris]